MASLILASGSPRRSELLQRLGIAFETYSPNINESLLENESAQDYVARLACEKATHALQLFPDHVILAADTCISLDGNIIGKPRSKTHAFEIWQALSGRQHEVLSGVCVMTATQKYDCVVNTQVLFQKLSYDEMQSYWSTGEPIDKAGAYAIQGIAAKYIPEIHGSYTNVVGLPLHETVKLLKAVKALN
ncbi:Maf family nucleotide pyrophosphatase [Acinetobacter sp. ESL0695]|uniref:Maf family nucleotide pyrophosphatase n=1 Tax=Acinetobacter sp. ESL0695 TaxID=2983215 RepID=UPI0023F0551E|nr:Maf family nucleotide pyrophosphatase [Acinetobacter sp. ESL0695]WEV48294.1 Maf family nucleotide pyrophosphatase [Acinetobacter sp. ESL0695]